MNDAWQTEEERDRNDHWKLDEEQMMIATETFQFFLFGFNGRKKEEEEENSKIAFCYLSASLVFFLIYFFLTLLLNFTSSLMFKLMI